MRVDDFDFALPEERIAREPRPQRDASRLLVLPRHGGALSHRAIAELPSLLREGDLLVFNDTRVLPARLVGRKPTGGRVELLLTEALGGEDPTEGRATQRWTALYTASKPVRPGARLDFGALTAELEEPLGEGLGRFRLETAGPSVRAALDEAGELPLPHYMGRAPDRRDAERYQTIFARKEGAVAAPTAGLHFTPELLALLQRAGVRRAEITLHVGPGTFLPVRAERLEDHRMHAEVFEVPSETEALVAETRARGGRVVAVGTTSLRTLESASDPERPGLIRAGRGRTDLFVRPGHALRVIDGLLTNFHLPRSTLLMLVAAVAGRERVLAAYAEAIAQGYAFYSYGDAMLIV